MCPCHPPCTQTHSHCRVGCFSPHPLILASFHFTLHQLQSGTAPKHRCVDTSSLIKPFPSSQPAGSPESCGQQSVISAVGLACLSCPRFFCSPTCSIWSSYSPPHANSQTSWALCCVHAFARAVPSAWILFHLPPALIPFLTSFSWLLTLKPH